MHPILSNWGWPAGDHAPKFQRRCNRHFFVPQREEGVSTIVCLGFGTFSRNNVFTPKNVVLGTISEPQLIIACHPACPKYMYLPDDTRHSF